MSGYMNHGFRLERKDADYSKKFYGKYRAIVTNNMDEKTDTGRMVRIKVKCPMVLGEDESNWCTPCMPHAGPQKGLVFVPRVGETVWVEFEGGNPDKPIWVGNWWAVGERPDPINESYDKKEVGLHHVIESEFVKMHFDDKDQVLTVTVLDTMLKMDGKNSKITMEAGGTTSVVMDGKAGAIHIESSSETTITTSKHTETAPSGIFMN